MYKYRNTVFHDFKSRFFVIFSSNYRYLLVLELPKSRNTVLKIFISCPPENTTLPMFLQKFNSPGKCYVEKKMLRKQMLKNSAPEVFWKTLSQKYVSIFKIAPTAGFILINIVSKRAEATCFFFTLEFVKNFSILKIIQKPWMGSGNCQKGILVHENVLEIQLEVNYRE